MVLLSVGNDAKTVKGVEYGVLTGILYLAPADESGVMNTCPNATAGCREACLFTAGRGAFANVKRGRINKTLWFHRDRVGFLQQLIKDITALIKKANKEGMAAAVRLNGTSDIAWESIKVDGKNLMEHFPAISFYDYTKSPSRIARFMLGQFPTNYHLTFSRSEDPVNQADCKSLWATKVNVAVVFRGGLPATWQGRPVIDGDVSDIRFNDPEGCVVGLKAKGKARKQDAGFVVQVA
jgi:hypothetical protein